MEMKKRQIPDNRNLEGQYANYFKVGNNAYEFVVDFGQFFPENGKAEIYSRIVTSPAYTKALVETLENALLRYEKQYGKIVLE